MTQEMPLNEFGYFGKLPAFGDFIQRLVPQDFATGLHEWLQLSMANARERLGEEFLAYYLNCPAWKFVALPGVCGLQAVTGLTIPSVDKVGRYFNFTLATTLPESVNPVSYVMTNASGFSALENAALDILEADYPKEELELKVNDLAVQFESSPITAGQVTNDVDHLEVSLDLSLPFVHQAGTLLSQLLQDKFDKYSVWWYGQEGVSTSSMLVCEGLPSPQLYLKLLTAETLESEENLEKDYVDQILSGDS